MEEKEVVVVDGLVMKQGPKRGQRLLCPMQGPMGSQKWRQQRLPVKG